MMETETLDKLYLEWSQFTEARTAREIRLAKTLAVRDDHLEKVLKAAYQYALGDNAVGTNQVTDMLCDALCNLIGDEKFQEYVQGLPG